MKKLFFLVFVILFGFVIIEAQTTGNYKKSSDTRLDGSVNPDFTDAVKLTISGNTFTGLSVNENRVIKGTIYIEGKQKLFTAMESGNGYTYVISGVISGTTFKGTWHDSQGQQGDLSWTAQ